MKQSDYAIKQIERNKPENMATKESIAINATYSLGCLTLASILALSHGYTFGVVVESAIIGYYLGKSYEYADKLVNNISQKTSKYSILQKK